MLCVTVEIGCDLFTVHSVSASVCRHYHLFCLSCALIFVAPSLVSVVHDIPIIHHMLNQNFCVRFCSLRLCHYIVWFSFVQ